MTDQEKIEEIQAMIKETESMIASNRHPDGVPGTIIPSNAELEATVQEGNRQIAALYSRIKEKLWKNVFGLVNDIWKDNRYNVVPHGHEEGDNNRGEAIDEEIGETLAEFQRLCIEQGRFEERVSQEGLETHVHPSVLKVIVK